MPISTPADFAAALAPHIFVRGGAPSKIATGLPRSSGSRRTTACTEKSGTNRHAKDTMQPRRRKLRTGGERWLLGTTGPNGARFPAGGIAGPPPRSGTHNLSLHFETLQGGDARRYFRRPGTTPLLRPAPALERNGGTTLRARR